MASSIAFGPIVGVTAGVANYVFSEYFASNEPKWFQMKNAVSHLKISASSIPKIIVSNTLFGVALLALGSCFNPATVMILNNQRVYNIFAKSALVTPVLEEIMYRGVLQEKVNSVISYSNLNLSPEIKKIIIIVIQAFATSFSCLLNMDSLAEFPLLFGMGCSLGYLKEITYDMWAPISSRFFLNSVICARVAILKA